MKNRFIKLIIGSLGGLHCVNEIIDHTTVRDNSTYKGYFYKWIQGDIYYTVSGKGAPVLLIHDLNVYSSGRDWTEIVRRLSKTNTVYTIDLLGCGRSDKPAITYTSYMYVQLVSDFIQFVVRNPVTVIASGFSSTFVLMAKYLEKDIISKMFLINPPALSALKKRPNYCSKALMFLSEIPVLSRTCYYIATNKTNTDYYLSDECFYNPFHVKPDHIRFAYKASHTGKGRGRFLYASLKGNYLNTDITKALEGEKEIIVLLGSKEPSMNEVRTTYHNINERITINIINDAKRLPQMEMPDIIYQVIHEELTKPSEEINIIK